METIFIIIGGLSLLGIFKIFLTLAAFEENKSHSRYLMEEEHGDAASSRRPSLFPVIYDYTVVDSNPTWGCDDDRRRTLPPDVY